MSPNLEIVYQFTDDELFYLERKLFTEQEACEFFKKKEYSLELIKRLNSMESTALQSIIDNRLIHELNSNNTNFDNTSKHAESSKFSDTAPDEILSNTPISLEFVENLLPDRLQTNNQNIESSYSKFQEIIT